MNFKIIYPLLSILLIACSSTSTGPSRKIASLRSHVDVDVIELDSPIKAEPGDDFLKARSKAHTVFDKDAAKYERQKKMAQLLNQMAGPFKFYRVKKNETLDSIAKKIYGDPGKSKLIHSWNYEVITTEEDLRPGIILKLLPRSRMPASK
jgi:nucleoid-associated protein YgaU